MSCQSRAAKALSRLGTCSKGRSQGLNTWVSQRRATHGTDSSVRINDVFFAGHASCIALATLAQCAVYERGSQRVHEHTRLAFAIMVPLTLTFGAAVWLFPHDISVISCVRLPVV